MGGWKGREETREGEKGGKDMGDGGTGEGRWLKGRGLSGEGEGSRGRGARRGTERENKVTHCVIRK